MSPAVEAAYPDEAPWLSVAVMVVDLSFEVEICFSGSANLADPVVSWCRPLSVCIISL